MTVSEAILRILETFIISSIIGMDREKTKRPAGLRTHVIVALGACLVTIAPAMYMGNCMNVDLTRMASQVLSGIGFLGAGTILRYKENVIGLTTAASLWACACLGIASGIGAHEITWLVGLLIITVLKVVPYIERKFFNKSTDFQITLTMKEDKDELLLISKIMKEKDVDIKSVSVYSDDNNRKVYKFNLQTRNMEQKELFLMELYKIDLASCKEISEMEENDS